MSETGPRSVAKPAVMTYTAVITAGDDGWFCAQVPEVPERSARGGRLERRE